MSDVLVRFSGYPADHFGVAPVSVGSSDPTNAVSGSSYFHRPPMNWRRAKRLYKRLNPNWLNKSDKSCRTMHRVLCLHEDRKWIIFDIQDGVITEFSPRIPRRDWPKRPKHHNYNGTSKR